MAVERLHDAGALMLGYLESSVETEVAAAARVKASRQLSATCLPHFVTIA